MSTENTHAELRALADHLHSRAEVIRDAGNLLTCDAIFQLSRKLKSLLAPALEDLDRLRDENDGFKEAVKLGTAQNDEISRSNFKLQAERDALRAEVERLQKANPCVPVKEITNTPVITLVNWDLIPKQYNYVFKNPSGNWGMSVSKPYIKHNVQWDVAGDEEWHYISMSPTNPESKAIVETLRGPRFLTWQESMQARPAWGEVPDRQPSIKVYATTCTQGYLPEHRPSVLFRPKLDIVNDMWVAVYGNTYPSCGVVGQGQSPHLAMLDFDKAFYEKIPTKEKK